VFCHLPRGWHGFHDAPMLHVAVVHRKYADQILSGRKTMEARLSKTRIAPFGVIEPGERIYIKASSGPYVCIATVYGVVSMADITPDDVKMFKRDYNSPLCGDDEYWERKAESNYATFIELSDVRPASTGPDLTEIRKRLPRAAWLVLPEDTPFTKDEPAAVSTASR